ncbi:titin [Echinococcus granulosus]|uniref:Titin n=1 Tax=Echinococcus granulosus TaxID=6210 RepID=W6USY0_ECHGR|nr:titin [Echinococcus granulosus]EUB64755.1 titin [Echinococcus granulosus]
MNTGTTDDADKTLQSIEAAKILADAEWRKLGSRVGLMDDRNVVAKLYSIWLSQLTGKREGVLQRKRLLSRILELGHDFNACSRKLEQLINAACCPDGAKSSRDYLKKLETINSEVMRLRNTVPAQEEVMEALSNDVKTVFNAETPTDLSKVQQVWSSYVQELCKFESILPTLMQNSQLLAAAHGFTNSLQSKFDGIIQDSESLKEVQQEAARLQKDIEHHLNSIENPLGPILNKASVEGLQSALGTLQEVGEEVEIMTTNLNNCMKPNGSPNSDCSPPLHHHGLYNDHQEYGNSRDSQQSSWELRANTLGYENDASFTEATLHVRPKLKRGLTDLSAIVDGNKCTVTGKEVAFFLEYGGFDKIPSQVVWLHNGRPIDPTKWTVSISLLTTRIKSDCLKSVDEGQYTCQVIDDELDVKLESSAILRLQNALDVPQPASRVSSRTGTPPGNEKSLWITRALDSSPLLLKCPLPSIAFEAYTGARRVRMQWFRDGIQLYDSDWQTPDYFTGSQGVSFVDGNTFWSVSVCEGRAVLLNTNRVRSVDAGRYSCRMIIDNDAYESSGKESISRHSFIFL